MNLDSLKLPKIFTANFGLSAKLSELNQNMPMRLRSDGWKVIYIAGNGVVANDKIHQVLGQYVQFANNKYKFVKEKN